MLTAPLFTSAELAQILGFKNLPFFNVLDWQIDTRALQKGHVFIALGGKNNDGHDYLQQAADAGAVAALVTHVPSNAPANLALLIVPNVLEALEKIGIAARQKSHAQMVFAITGSVGKTTVRAMLEQACKSLQPTTYASTASFNNHLGVPLSLSRLPQNTALAVFEVGMNHAGEITPLSQMIRPHVSVITNIAPAHIEHLGSIENIAHAKAEIFAGQQVGQACVLPRDSDQFDILHQQANQSGLNIITFGTNPQSDVCVDIANNTLTIAGQIHSFELTVDGDHNKLNAACVVAALMAANLPWQQALPALKKFQPVRGRGNKMFVHLTPNTAPITVIDDRHNANPESVTASLASLAGRTKASDERYIVVLGNMLELGDNTAAYHAAIKNDLARVPYTHLFCCGDLMSHLAAVMPPSTTTYAPDSLQLAQLVANFVQAGDVVLVKGSRGAQMWHIINAITARDTTQIHPTIGA
jgi:UDP-N-acetylmuramoyl-tripeptide--D-alanyl-D-alanine ligase